MMFIKLSIGIFLLRLAVQKVYKYILWGSLFVVTVWSTVIFFWDIFQCNPVAAQWDYTIPNSKCVTADQIVSAAYAISVMTILTDWLYVSDIQGILTRLFFPFVLFYFSFSLSFLSIRPCFTCDLVLAQRMRRDELKTMGS